MTIAGTMSMPTRRKSDSRDEKSITAQFYNSGEISQHF